MSGETSWPPLIASAVIGTVAGGFLVDGATLIVLVAAIGIYAAGLLAGLAAPEEVWNRV